MNDIKIMSNWISGFSNVPYNYSPLENLTSIDSFFQDKSTDNIDVLQMIELKEEVINILQGKEVIDWDEDEEDEEGKKEKEDNEINKIMSIIQENVDNFNQKQIELKKINESFQKELKIIQDNANTVDNMIDFIKSLPNEQKDEVLMKDIIDKMKVLCKTIMNNEKIKKIKGDYIKSRKEIQKYIQLIKQINKFNVCNICPLCFTNTVDHFLDPCGHSFCKECILKTIGKKEDKDLYTIGRDENINCSFCRRQWRHRPNYPNDLKQFP